MSPEEVQNILTQAIEDSEVQATSNDGSHFQIMVISDQFEGLRAVKRQQMIYAHLGEYITGGALHAVGIKTYTKKEWEKAKNLQVG